jgi:peptidoglycan/LPS O-acetylase OafA/YrhL
MNVHAELPMPSNVRKIDSLQLLRAFAVIVVAWVHAGQIMFLVTGRLLPSLGVYGIDVFFVISGFIMASILFRSKDMGPGLFLRRRATRIFPVYWIFVIIGAAEMAERHAHITAAYLPSILLLPGYSYSGGPALLVAFSWTLVFEMAFYYIVATALAFTKRKAIEATIVLLCALVGISLIVDIRHPVAIVFLNPMLLEFVLGCLVALLYRRCGRCKFAGMALCVAGLGSAIALMRSHLPVANGMHMVMSNSHVWMRVSTWGISAACLVAGMVLWSPDSTGAIPRVFVALGDASYSTYLISSFVIELGALWVVRAEGPKAAISAGLQWFIQAAIVASVLIAGFAFYRIVEWPLLRRLTRS